MHGRGRDPGVKWVTLRRAGGAPRTRVCPSNPAIRDVAGLTSEAEFTLPNERQYDTMRKSVHRQSRSTDRRTQRLSQFPVPNPQLPIPNYLARIAKYTKSWERLTCFLWISKPTAIGFRRSIVRPMHILPNPNTRTLFGWNRFVPVGFWKSCKSLQILKYS